MSLPSHKFVHLGGALYTGWWDRYEGEKGYVKDGLKEGEWVSHYSNGQLSSKVNYKNGKPEGTWVWYHDNRQLWKKGFLRLAREATYKNGKNEGEYVSYHENGQLGEKGTYKNGKHEGEYVSYHENGQLLEKGTYKNGNKEGEWVYYCDNEELWEKKGLLQLLKKGTYKNGEPDGKWVVYWKNRQLWRQSTYKDGVLEGKWVRYHDNRQLWKKGTYKNGLLEGAWVQYHRNGKLLEKGTYKNGECIKMRTGSVLKRWAVAIKRNFLKSQKSDSKIEEQRYEPKVKKEERSLSKGEEYEKRMIYRNQQRKEKYEIMRKFLDTHDERSLLKSIINRELPFPVNMLPVDDTKKLELQSELMSSKDINVFLDMLPRKRGCAPHISNLRDQLIRLKGKNSLWRDVRNVFRRSIQFS